MSDIYASVLVCLYRSAITSETEPFTLNFEKLLNSYFY